MFKTNALLVVVASVAAFSACKKDEKGATESAKTTEPAADKAADKAGDKAGDKAADTAPATEAKPEEKAPEAAAEMTREEVGEKAVAIFTKMADSVKAANGDCDKIATEITAIITEAKPVMEAGNKLDKDPENKKWFDEKYGKQLEGIMTGMMGGLGGCMEHEGVMKAFEGLE
jgi:hypothetical protein